MAATAERVSAGATPSVLARDARTSDGGGEAGAGLGGAPLAAGGGVSSVGVRQARGGVDASWGQPGEVTRCVSADGRENGFGFHLDILKECQERVQAFLEDADSVLSALDQCQAEEKCLMLIKRPKESARKMLKSHSWANLSVSEPQLNRQFNGVSLGQLHPVTYQPYMMRRSSDQQSVTSCETDRSDGRRKYVTARGKENWRRQGQLSLPDGSGFTSQPNGNYHMMSDGSSTASDYGYVDRKGDRSRRGELCPSIPEDEQEINNNNYNSNGDNKNNNNNSAASASKKPVGSGFRSYLDGSQDLVPNSGGCDPRRHGGQRQVQGQREQGQVRREPAQEPRRRASEGVSERVDLEDAARSQSLSNLATGLTLSLVGQRRADSMLDLTLSPRHPPPRSAASRSSKSQSAYPSTRHSPRESGSDSVRSPTDSYPEVFSPREAVSSFHYATVQSPARASQDRSYSCSTQPVQRSHRNYGNRTSSEPPVPARDVIVPPQKPKRSLPHVPPEETSEKIKRFTEIMRSRMSISSSNNGRGSDNSASSRTSVTPQTPESRQASVTDTGSDAEVSTLLEGGPGERSAPSRQKHGVEAATRHQPAAATSAVRVRDAEGRGRLPPPHPHHTMSASSGSSSGASTMTQTTRRPSLLQDTPQHFGDHSSSGDSGQTPFTSHSHSSTMDSGYTTNTEGELDALDHVTKPSPPHCDVRPTPAPRNPALAASRKFNSLQNVSSLHAHGNSLQPYSHQQPRQNREVSASSGRGHALAREAGSAKAAQHAVLAGHAGDQRRSWNLAQNFKSLDFKPLDENSCRELGPSSLEERVLRPQAVVMNAGARSAEVGGGSGRRNSFSKQNLVVSGNTIRDGGSRPGVKPEQLRGGERHSANTLPGHWKYTAAVTPSGSRGSSSSSQRARPAALVAPPTLFQMSQNYALCAVKLALPDNVTVKDILTLATVQVVLPGMAADGSGGRNSQLSEGRQVQLGGPGSAFRPVRAGSQAAIGMTGVGALQDGCSQLCVVGDLRTGDVLVELNGWYCLNSDHLSLQRVLQNCQGEVTLTVARKKEEADSRAEDSVQDLESEVMRLKEEVSKKDARIQELSTVMAWRKDSPCPDKVLLDSEEGAFVISDNEFVV